MGDYLRSSSRKVQREYNRIWTALRFTILIALTGDSSRELAIRVSDSRLLKWFTSFDVKAKGTSKSAIDRHEKQFTADEITNLIHTLNQAVGNAELARRLILESELGFSRHWVDSTLFPGIIRPSEVRRALQMYLFRGSGRISSLN